MYEAQEIQTRFQKIYVSFILIFRMKNEAQIL